MQGASLIISTRNQHEMPIPLRSYEEILGPIRGGPFCGGAKNGRNAAQEAGGKCFHSARWIEV
jgi:hypothetical protein